MRISDWISDVCSSDLPSLPNQLRARVDHAFLSARLTYNLFAEASTSAILIPAVREGLAATILPYSAAQPETASGIINAHSLDFNLSREISLCSSISAPENPAVHKVISLTKGLIKQLIRDKYWPGRSEEHTSELQSLMRISYADFCFKQQKK